MVRCQVCWQTSFVVPNSAPDVAWQQIPRTRAYELVINQIESQIMAGALKVGDQLPAERDLAAKLGKKVDFITHGAATELDKSLVEKITDPLTHLVRNSCDHGIEPPAERRERGKPFDRARRRDG